MSWDGGMGARKTHKGQTKLDYFFTKQRKIKTLKVKRDDHTEVYGLFAIPIRGLSDILKRRIYAHKFTFDLEKYNMDPDALKATFMRRSANLIIKLGVPFTWPSVKEKELLIISLNEKLEDELLTELAQQGFKYQNHKVLESIGLSEGLLLARSSLILSLMKLSQMGIGFLYYPYGYRRFIFDNSYTSGRVRVYPDSFSLSPIIIHKQPCLSINHRATVFFTKPISKIPEDDPLLDATKKIGGIFKIGKMRRLFGVYIEDILEAEKAKSNIKETLQLLGFFYSAEIINEVKKAFSNTNKVVVAVPISPKLYKYFGKKSLYLPANLVYPIGHPALISMEGISLTDLRKNPNVRLEAIKKFLNELSPVLSEITENKLQIDSNPFIIRGTPVEILTNLEEEGTSLNETIIRINHSNIRLLTYNEDHEETYVSPDDVADWRGIKLKPYMNGYRNSVIKIACLIEERALLDAAKMFLKYLLNGRQKKDGSIVWAGLKEAFELKEVIFNPKDDLFIFNEDSLEDLEEELKSYDVIMGFCYRGKEHRPDYKYKMKALCLKIGKPSQFVTEDNKKSIIEKAFSPRILSAVARGIMRKMPMIARLHVLPEEVISILPAVIVGSDNTNIPIGKGTLKVNVVSVLMDPQGKREIYPGLVEGENEEEAFIKGGYERENNNKIFS